MIKQISSDKDIKRCALVIRRAFKTVADEFGLTEKTAPTNPAFITCKKLKQWLDQGIELFGLVKVKRIIGCIAIERSRKDEKIFFIERLAVLPEERHKGYGTELMDYACVHIKKKCGTIASIGIINENHILKEWYIKYGFKEISTKRFRHLPFTVCFLEKSV